MFNADSQPGYQTVLINLWTIHAIILAWFHILVTMDTSWLGEPIWYATLMVVGTDLRHAVKVILLNFDVHTVYWID